MSRAIRLARQTKQNGRSFSKYYGDTRYLRLVMRVLYALEPRTDLTGAKAILKRAAFKAKELLSKQEQRKSDLVGDDDLTEETP